MFSSNLCASEMFDNFHALIRTELSEVLWLYACLMVERYRIINSTLFLNIGLLRVNAVETDKH